MSNATDPVRLVRDVIQRVYNDATQTVLDQQAASEIVTALRNAGWCSLEEAAMLIEGAGGSITVPHRVLADSREVTVDRYDEYGADGVTFWATRAAQ